MPTLTCGCTQSVAKPIQPLRITVYELIVKDKRGLQVPSNRQTKPSFAAAGDEWNACCGGGVDAFAVDSGVRHFTAALPESTAWGYGADPVVLEAGSGVIYVVGRDASLHSIDATTGASHQLSNAIPPADNGGGQSLGIGHAALRDGSIYAGFSRGGFRLWRYAVSKRFP